MHNLGLLCERMHLPDLDQARTWYEKAAAASDPAAMNNPTRHKAIPPSGERIERSTPVRQSGARHLVVSYREMRASGLSVHS